MCTKDMVHPELSKNFSTLLLQQNLETLRNVTSRYAVSQKYDRFGLPSTIWSDMYRWLSATSIVFSQCYGNHRLQCKMLLLRHSQWVSWRRSSLFCPDYRKQYGCWYWKEHTKILPYQGTPVRITDPCSPAVSLDAYIIVVRQFLNH